MRSIVLVIAAVLAMGSVANAQTVGVTAAVNPAATGIAPSQKPKTMVLGEDVIHDEKISTDAKGLVQILLADGSSFTVGPNSTMVIDSFVYDPNAGTAQVVATLGKGAFRFIGGKASKQPDGVTLNTPVGTVGVRGGISNLDFTGATPSHIDMVYGQGVTLKDGTQIIGDLYHSGYSIVIDPNGKVNVTKTPPEWTALFQQLMTGNGSGAGGTVKTAEVKNTLTNTNKNPDQPGGGAPGIPAGGDIKPGSTTGDVVDNDPLTTWAQIDNSDLRTVEAMYQGTYSATIEGGEAEEELGSNVSNLPFQLNFAFASRTGTAYFGEYEGDYDSLTSDPLVVIPVEADDLTGNGHASFGYHGVLTDPDLQPSNPYCECTHSGTADLTGNFLNTSGIASGVQGTFNATVNNGEDGDYTVNGAFGGNYVGPAH